MKSIIRFLFALCAVALVTTPVVHAQSATSTDLLAEIRAMLGTDAHTSASASFSRDGIFGCSGSSYGAVGAQGPSGSHVPVFDSALFDQQRLLTYKECLLDGIASSAKEALISIMVKVTVEWAQAGNNGQSAFVTDPQAYELAARDAEVEKFISEVDASSLPEVDKRTLKEAILRDYIDSSRSSVTALSCPLTEQQITAFRNGRYIDGGGAAAYKVYRENVACNPTNAFLFLSHNLSTRLENISEQTIADLDRGNGFPSITQDRVVDLGNGETAIQKQIVTPGYLIAQQLSLVLGTGLRQAENATEIDTLVSSALANLGTRMLTDLNGFVGLATSLGGQPSYVARLAADAANRTREKMVGAAAAILNNTINTEEEFVRAQAATMAIFNNARNQLEEWENACYLDMAISHVTESLEAQVCLEPDSGRVVTCSVSITVDEEYAPDTIIVRSPTPATLSVQGYASRSGSRIELVVGDGTTTPVSLTPSIDGMWVSDSIDISDYDDGTISVSATEYFADDSGTYGPVTALVTKTTTGNGVEITTPTERPNLTVTAAGGGKTETITLSRDATRSNALAASNITPNQARVYKEVTASQRALAVLVQMRAALASATTAAGQREILDILDQLVARHLLHSESDLRTAEGQSNEVSTMMTTLLEQTKNSWEATWCKPANWPAHVVQ